MKHPLSILLFLCFSLVKLSAQVKAEKKSPESKPDVKKAAGKSSVKITNDTLVFGKCKYLFKTKLREDSCLNNICKYYLDFAMICPMADDCRDGNSIIITLTWKENGKWKKDKIISRDCSTEFNAKGGGCIGNSKTNPKKEYKIKHLGGYDAAKVKQIDYAW